MDKLSWDLLRLLILCSRHKNFKEAAQEAGVRPPAFSKQIKRLEEQVGQDLFERVNDNAYNKLTPVGYDLLQKVLMAEKIIQGQSDHINMIPDHKDIKIYTSHDISSTFLSNIITTFYHYHQDIPVHVITHEMPRSLEPDSLIIGTYINLQKESEKIKLLDLEMGFYASQDYIERKGHPHTYEDISSHNFLLLQGTKFLNKITDKDLDLSPKIISDDMGFLCSLCHKGHGILALPCIDQETHPLIRVLAHEPLLPQSLYLASCLKRKRTSSVSAFIYALQTFIKDKIRPETV